MEELFLGETCNLWRLHPLLSYFAAHHTEKRMFIKYAHIHSSGDESRRT